MAELIMKRCRGCGQDKPLDQFARNTSNRENGRPRARDGRSTRCLECLRSAARAVRGTEEYRAQKRAEYAIDPAERARRQAGVRRANQKVKAATFAAYGGRCACCGETEPVFLSIDHVNGNGNAHRRAIGHSGYTLHRWLRDRGWPAGFALLCHNCNHGRWINGGVCPHQERAAKPKLRV